ncbi:hypothetical protein [Lentiprolixibacter aurantiacus]|uniref:Two component regulator three Y domain-containing protein n=1 Tax=Lentiprolixibacter aurantiacus TaxID=2993939 RepID=A0AAE3MKX3_9FLAO|nr:hypothetical protein [Lentiprolixibacter aurantiacus]MCX2718794.1 hypothetical protein [Lentiprolixibacter aurantiacus]
MGKTLFTCAALLCIWSSVGQNMHVSWYSAANGLPSDEVRHVAWDTLGFAWIATDDGLVRFDGSSFESYSQFVPSQYVKYLLNTSEGLLLSHDAGISLLQPALDTTGISLLYKSSIQQTDTLLYYPNQIFLRSNGNILAGQPGGQMHYLTAEGIESFMPEFFQVSERSTNLFFGEVAGRLWIARSDGSLFLFNENNRTLEKKASFTGIQDIKTKENTLWVASDKVYSLQLSPDGARILERESFPSTPGEVTALALDAQENVYLGIRDKGLYYLDRTQAIRPNFIKIYGNNDPHTVEELPFRNINTIIIDTSGKLWVCSSEGLGILQKRFFEGVGSIPNANATAISIAENGRIFVNFGDLYRIESTDFGYEGEPLPTASLGTITSLTTEGERLWTGTSTGKLHELDQDGRLLRTIDLEDRGEGIFFLEVDSNDRLWLAQAPKDKPLLGVGCLMPDGSFIEYGAEKGLDNRIICIREIGKGRIYASGIGEDTYLFRYVPEKDSFVNLSLDFDFYTGFNFQVHDFAVDEKGIIWLASSQGLLRHDMESVSKVDLGAEYDDIEIKSVKVSADGSVWISLDTEGVLRYTDENTMVMKEESGLPSKVMSYRCMESDKKGRFWIGTAEGIVYSLEENAKPGMSSRPLLVSATVNGIESPLNGLHIKPDHEISVAYTAPSFHGFRTFFQYRIDDSSWSDPISETTMNFTGMTPGNYELAIRAKKEGAYLWSQPEQLNFTVSQYWYKSRTFIWVSGLILTGIFVVLFISQKRRFSLVLNAMSQGLKAKEEEVVKQEADLLKVREEVRLKLKERKANLLVLEIMHRLISKIGPGTKWDFVLEYISTDLLKLPGVVAFEIGVRRGKHLEFEGYSERVRGFTSARVPYDPDISLAAYCIAHAKPFLFNRLDEEGHTLLKKKDTRIAAYKAAISVPFYINNTESILTVYADKEDLFDEHMRKAFQIFASYLEQIV